MHLNSAASSQLDIIYCNHEQAVVSAADGYAKAADFSLPGLAIVTSGPGVTNTITAVASAFFDSVPIILLSGQIKSDYLNRYSVRSYGPQEVPHAELLRPITKLTFTYNPSEVDNQSLAQNLALAMTGRKGPVHIDIPLDVQAQDLKTVSDVNEVVAAYHLILGSEIDHQDTLSPDVLNALASSQRPVLVLGNGLKIASVPQDTIDTLVNRLGCPILLTWASIDLLEYSHPLCFGCAGGLAGVHSNRILQAADLIIFLGTRLDLLTTGFSPENYGKNARRFVVELDPNERSKYAHIPSIQPIAQDVRVVARDLCHAVPPPQNILHKWLTQCRAWQAENQKAEDREFADKKLSIYHVANLTSGCNAARYIVPTAAGYAIEGFARFYKALKNSRFSWAGHVLGSMGLAIPSAIGASARLQTCVVCVDCDGGLLLNVQELLTIRANPQLAIAIIVLNNNGYTSIRVSQSRAFKRNFGAGPDSGLASMDFASLAEISGLRYMPCSTHAQLENSINEICSSSRVFIDVFLDDDDYRGPAISTIFDDNGIPYSTPLEEVSWR